MLLAHLSDIHLPPMPRARLVELGPKQLLGWLNWHLRRNRRHQLDVLDAVMADLAQQRPDHVAVTGDLVNIGLPAELAAASRWLARLGSPQDVTVVPGNHDVYGAVGVDSGVACWAPYMHGDASATDRRGFPFIRRLGDVALIGCSSGVATPLFNASGRLGRAQRERLRTVLRDVGTAGLYRVVLIHHAPFPDQAASRCGLTDADGLAAVLSEAGAELVLHGHHHHLMRKVLPLAAGGHVAALGVPSASAAGPLAEGRRPAYHLFAIKRMAGGWEVTATARRLGADGRIVSVPLSLP